MDYENLHPGYENLKNLLLSYPELQRISTSRIRCSLTGHEMPAHYETVLHFVQGTKFQRVKRLQTQLQQHEQYFEDRGPYLFCKLTGRRLTKDGDVIEKHINGRRFRSALKATTADENGNQMDASPLAGPCAAEPRLIDDSDEDETELVAAGGNYDNGSTSSSSSMRDVEASANGDLYPELDTIDHVDGGDSDYDFNAMDTEFDDEAPTKRKADRHSEIPAFKRRRC